MALPLLLAEPLLASLQAPVLERYDFSKSKAEQNRLPGRLREISGLAVGPDGRLFAHNDERAVIYELDPATGDILKAFSAGFGGALGDFEGIAVAGDRFFLSSSSGEILETAEGSDRSTMSYRVHTTGMAGRCEFEGLAFDPFTETLLLPCKEPREDQLEDHIVVFSVEPENMAVSPVPRVFLPLDALEAFDLDASFAPSGIEVDTATGHILLVAAQEEAILEFSPQGALLGGRTLHKGTHPQPEGIALAADGTILLADEGQGNRGRLTRYAPLEREEVNR